MRWLLDMVGMSAGGWLGWKIGAWISLFTGYMAGVLGMGVGLYLARRLIQDQRP